MSPYCVMKLRIDLNHAYLIFSQWRRILKAWKFIRTKRNSQQWRNWIMKISMTHTTPLTMSSDLTTDWLEKGPTWSSSQCQMRTDFILSDLILISVPVFQSIMTLLNCHFKALMKLMRSMKRKTKKWSGTWKTSIWQTRTFHQSFLWR